MQGKYQQCVEKRVENKQAPAAPAADHLVILDVGGDYTLGASLFLWPGDHS